MKIKYIFFLVILSVFLTGCVFQNNSNQPSKIIIADEEFCIAKTESGIGSQEAYEIAKTSECATLGNIPQECNCDNSTMTCSFDLETDKANCQPVCLVDLKTATAKIDWNCTIETPVGE